MTKFTRTQAAVAREEELQGCDRFEQLRGRVNDLKQRFRTGPLTPRAAYDFEKALKTLLDEFGCGQLEEEYNRAEPEDKKQAAVRVRYRGEEYRINKKTPAQVASSFGTLTLRSFYYLCATDGEPGLHPLHVQLGIVAGSGTAVLGERAARWAVDYSQREVRQLLEREHGLKWSNDLLRKVLRKFRRTAVAFRANLQAQQLLQWLDEAERSRGRHRPVLAAGRDGIMIPIRGHGYQEGSTATVSVYDRRRKRLGTVYLGQMPEKEQATLTADLTALLTAVLQQRTGPVPRLVYITDNGKTPDSYYRNVLRRMRDPRQPGQVLTWERVLDFFHVCGYVSKLREALFGEKGHRWFERMRRWLRERKQGVAQILRSAMQHLHQRSLSKAAEKEFWKAYGYLRRHSCWMKYARYRRLGLPIGSGVTEAACKTVFTQRFKRSGMRWHKDSGQVILDLRVLHLSGVWDDAVRLALDWRSQRLPERASYRSLPEKNLKKAA